MLNFLFFAVHESDWNIFYFYSMVFLTLLFCHFLGDFVFQTDYIAKNKDPKVSGTSMAWYILFTHSFIHAGLVLLMTWYLEATAIMLVTHFIVDWLKIKGYINFAVDQVLHIFVVVILTVLYCGYILN